jgi:hypothetical protein
MGRWYRGVRRRYKETVDEHDPTPTKVFKKPPSNL